MTIKPAILRRSVAVAAIAFASSAVSVPAWAQDQQQQQNQAQQGQQNQAGTAAEDQNQTDQAQQDQAQGNQQQNQSQAAQAQQQQPDVLVAMVGDTEIRSSDVIGAIQALPPQLKQMPTEMLIPAVVDQLIVSSLIVEQARSEDLQDDPEVVALVQPGVTAVEDQALVQVWLQRELGERVNDAAVQQAYADLQETNPDMTQSIDELRPALEQNLRQEAMNAIRSELQQGVEITLYGPDGQPLAPSAQATGSTTQDEPADATQTQEQQSD